MNILITSAGRRSYLVEYFKKVLHGKGNVFVANSNPINPAFRVADHSVVTPLIYDEGYIPFLLKYCRENEINILISLFDIDEYILAKNKSKFEKIGTQVIVSSSEFVKICNDKWLTFCYLKENSFLTPLTFKTLESAKEALESGYLKYPVIVKPRFGMGSLSVYKANNLEELKIFYEKVKREIFNSYMKYESSFCFDESVVIQQVINGQEYGMDVINDLNGKYQNCVIRKKIAMRSGETDCAEIIDDEDIYSIGKKLGNITGHVANLDVDLFKTNECIYILEMNARFGGGYPFSHLAGVNLPLAIVNWCEGKKVDSKILSVKRHIVAHKDINIVEI